MSKSFGGAGTTHAKAEANQWSVYTEVPHYQLSWRFPPKDDCVRTPQSLFYTAMRWIIRPHGRSALLPSVVSIS